jgi:myo-inositol-1(or 4)-monophosphatase
LPAPDLDFDAVLAVVRDAAELAHHHWRENAVPDARVWEKEKGSPVCDIDLAVDAMLKNGLLGLSSDIGWLSEETVDDPARLDKRCVWLVDPIDGTRDYVRGRSGWCISVALVADGAPVFATMLAPVEGKHWIAHLGDGVWCNGEKLLASTRTEFVGARVPTDHLPQIDRDLVIVEKPNSIAMRLTMIACDRADLVATVRWGYEWDIAAAHLIATEAGAKISNAVGTPLRYNKPDPCDFGLVCSAPGIHAAAVERLASRASEYIAKSGVAR